MNPTLGLWSLLLLARSENWLLDCMVCCWWGLKISCCCCKEDEGKQRVRESDKRQKGGAKKGKPEGPPPRQGKEALLSHPQGKAGRESMTQTGSHSDSSLIQLLVLLGGPPEQPCL